MKRDISDMPADPGIAGTATRARNATLLLLSALTIMAGATISPSLPAIEAHFAGSPNAALLTRLVLTVPALFIALCAPFAGILVDRFGRRPVALGAVLIYALTGMSGLVVDSLPAMLVGRAGLGIAVAGVMTTATTLIGDYFSGAARNRFMGFQAAFMGLGGLFFLTGGGLLAEIHWRAPFLVYGIALLLVPALLAFIAEPDRTSDTGDAAAGGAADPPLALLPLAAVFAAAILNSVAFYLMPTQLPFYLRTLGTDAPTLAGLAMGGMTALSATSSLLYGRLRGFLGVSSVFALAFAVLGTGLAMVAMAHSFAMVLPAAALVGLGLGMAMPNFGSAAMALAGEANRGRVAGGLTASIFIGQFVSPFASQPIAEAAGYDTAFATAAAAIALAALTALLVATRQGRRAAA